MNVRRLFVLAAVTTAAVVVPLAPSYADPVSDLYVESPANQGSDGNDCLTDANPCATVTAALFKADAEGTTIHVGEGAFDGPVRPGAISKSVTIDGVSPDLTTLTNTESDDFTVVNLYGGTTTTLSNLSVDDTGTFFPVSVQDAGHLIADHVDVDGGVCGITVLTGGEAEVTDSTVQNGGGTGASCSPVNGQYVNGDIGVVGGTVELTRTRLLSPTLGRAGVDQLGGTLTVDQSYFDALSDPDTSGNTTSGLRLQSGAATITRSTVNGFDTGLRVSGGAVTASDSTFFGNVVGATTSGGSATIVRSTLQNQLGDLYNPGGTLAAAGAVLGAVGAPGQACTGPAPIADLGYNLAADGSCGYLEGSTSRNDVTNLDLDTAVADRGGPVPTLAILNPSSAVDAIPAGATYGDPTTPLCPPTGDTDLRGVPRPAGGACDAGSTEMAATVTTVDGPAKAAPGADTTFDAQVDVPDSATVSGLEFPVGTVTFTVDGQQVCLPISVSTHGEASCNVSTLAAGRHAVVATFLPTEDSTLHASESSALPVLVGTQPGIKGPGRVAVRVGRKATITLRPTGRPTARLTVTKGRAPAGMRISTQAGKLVVSGKAKASAIGRHTLKVRATNLMGSATHTLTIVVKRR